MNPVRSLLVAPLAFAACGGVNDTNGKVPDAAMVDGAPSTPRCDPMAPFTSIAPVDELNRPEASVMGWDEYARLSPDGLTVYFSTGRDGGQLDIYKATRTSVDQRFGTPAPVEGVNTAAQERTPTITADGLTMLAMQSGHPGYEIVIAQRASLAAQFGSFALLANVNSTTSDDGDTYVLPDGSALYFYSSRNGTPALYRAPRTATGYGDPSPVSGVKLNQPGIRDGAPVVSADELSLYFWTDRDGAGTGTIYVATRPTLADGFGAPVQVAGGVNTAENGEWPTWLSPDGCTLYFTRSQGNTAANYDVYVARRSP